MTVKKLHNKAMTFAHAWVIAQYRKDERNARKFAKSALKYEARAARMVPVGKKNEPSRSILFRSAATLAFWAGDIKEAEKLIKEGNRPGFTPAEIKKEFEDLEEKIKEQL